MMKFKYLLLIGVLSALIVLAGCNVKPGAKAFAGQAVAGFSDAGCVEGPWWYEDASGSLIGEGRGGFFGCTEYDSAGQPWCATGTVDKEGKQASVSGSGTWKYCEKIQQGRERGSADGEVSGTEEIGVGASSCSDSDSGKDFLTKGKVTVDGAQREDYCYTFADGSVYLFEAICGSEAIGNDPQYYVQKKCEEGSGAQGMEKGAYVCGEGKCGKKDEESKKVDPVECKDLWVKYVPCQNNKVMAEFENSCTKKTSLQVTTDCSSYKGGYKGGQNLCIYADGYNSGCEEQYTCTIGEEIVMCDELFEIDSNGDKIGKSFFEYPKFTCQNGKFIGDNMVDSCPSGLTCQNKYNKFGKICA